MRRQSFAVLSFVLSSLILPLPAAAQRLEVGVQASFVNSSEFDDTATGVGGRVAFYPSSWVGAEAEINLYPGDFPGEGRAFTSSQREGLFGVTVGPRLGWVRPFVRLRPGFVRFSASMVPRCASTICRVMASPRPEFWPNSSPSGRSV